MATWQKLALIAGVATAGVAMAQPAQQQKVTGPVAVYWMSAATQSGFGMPGMGGGAGGGRPSMGQMMAMMRGGGGAQHNLTLQLGSARKASGDPAADHLPPQALGAGADLPLVTPPPPQQAAPQREEEPPPIPREYQKPRGRMLIFWGCGAHAGPGQPVVIDFSQMTPDKMTAGKMPPGMEALTHGLGVRPMRPPSQSTYATYGEWPNSRSNTTVPSEGSLVGDHVVRGNYSPEIKFGLDSNQDFLGPLTLTTNAKTPDGFVQLGWSPVAGAEAYIASAIGGGQNETVVLWSSSQTQAAAFALPDYLTPGDIQRLVANHTLMDAQTTSCAVPKEVLDAAPQALLQMVAYGHEANFVYPPRPKDPKVTWNQEWTVKVRYRSATGGMLGHQMPAMGGGGGYPGAGAGGDNSAQQAQPQSPEDAKAARRRAIMQGLGGMMGLPH